MLISYRQIQFILLYRAPKRLWFLGKEPEKMFTNFTKHLNLSYLLIVRLIQYSEAQNYHQLLLFKGSILNPNMTEIEHFKT